MTETRIEKDDLDPSDQAALDLAIRLILSEDPEMARTIRAYLKENSWWEAASLACYSRQMDHLQLDPHEEPPCWIDENEIDAIVARGPGIHNNAYGGAKLLQKMIALGVSKYDPKPIDSMAAAERASR